MPMNPGRLGDRWATDSEGKAVPNKGCVNAGPAVVDRNSPQGNQAVWRSGDEGQLFRRASGSTAIPNRRRSPAQARASSNWCPRRRPRSRPAPRRMVH